MALARRHPSRTARVLIEPAPPLLQPLYSAIPLVLAPALISDPIKLLRASLLSGSIGGGRGDSGGGIGGWLTSGLGILQKGPVGMASDATEVT